ncbi:winged helix-turn-helix domain-containing protein [Umezawaea beigongshangensis]|uniref:winged helix-turn-helix domain-containing protein n=1 Tax=Umezawaea beigongshangensis TaxID=2780383 RepID=UPI0018F138DE|nr:winged helix-turn-helix domain-containing protein [Umezawaea beigongshangensis]
MTRTIPKHHRADGTAPVVTALRVPGRPPLGADGKNTVRLLISISVEAEAEQIAAATTRVVQALREAGLAVDVGVPQQRQRDVEVRVLPHSRRVLHRGSPVELSRLEFDLLLFLCEHPDRVHRRRDLLFHVWGGGQAGVRTVDVHVRRIRGKLGAAADLISTVRGIGYLVESGQRVRVEREDLIGRSGVPSSGPVTGEW